MTYIPKHREYELINFEGLFDYCPASAKMILNFLLHWPETARLTIKKAETVTRL